MVIDAHVDVTEVEIGLERSGLRRLFPRPNAVLDNILRNPKRATLPIIADELSA